MTYPDHHLLISLAALLLTTAVTIRAIYFRITATKISRERDQALALLKSSREELRHLKEQEKRCADFKSDLNTAEISTKMQQSRTVLSCGSGNVEIPERYRYVHNLSQKGISSSDIAAILSISNNEAEQLVALANLSRH